MKKGVQTIGTNQYIPVKKDLTSKANYKSVVDSIERRDVVFTEFVNFIRTHSKLRDHNYLVFNQYIRDAFDLINQCWGEDLEKYCSQSIKSIEDILHNPEFQQSLPIECSMYQASKFENLQTQLIQLIKQQNGQIQLFYESAEKYNIQRHKTLNYYNPNYLKQPYIELSKLYHFLEESDIKNKKLINKLQKNKIKFLSIFGTFRKVAAKNRIVFEKKIYKMCGLVVDNVIKVFNKLHNKLKQLKINLIEAENQIEHSGNSEIKKEKYEFFNKASSDDIFSINCFVTNIRQTMSMILKSCKEHRLRLNKKLCESMKIQDSIPSQAFNFVLETFQKMFSRITQIVNNLSDKSRSLQEYERKLNQLGSSTTASNYQSSIRKIKSFNQQKTLLIPQVICGILDDMIDPLAKLILWGETSLSKQKKIYLQDDVHLNDKTRMSIDNGIDEDYVHQQDIWMFQDWKATNSIRLPQFNKVKQELIKIKDQIDTKKKLDGKQIMAPQKSSLLISGANQKKGILYVYDNWVKFISSQDDLMIIVPYEDINDVKKKLQGIKVNIFLYTPKGQIVFINPDRATKCQKKIFSKIKNKNKHNNQTKADQIDDQNLQGGVSAPKWKSIELTPGEIAGMEARKAKVLAEIPDKKGWEEVNPTQIFKNVTIDQMYDQLYSDKPKQISGKKWKSFNHFQLTHLGGNSNIEDGKFNSKGPKFYTLEDGQTFQTCPIFSERTNTYDHALKGLGFLPVAKSVKCKQIVRIYWISNEEFVMLIEASSSGVPFTDCFYLKFMHHLKKQGDNVEVNYHATVIFVKQTFMKSKLQKTCISQVKQNLPKTIKAQQSRLRSLAGQAKGQQDIESPQQQINTVKKQSVKQNSADTQNILYLMGGVIGFLIIIKLLKMILF